MNYRLIGNILGKILWVEAAFLLVPLAVSLVGRDGCAASFALSIALCLALGAVPLLFPIRRQRMQSIDGYVAVALSWLCLSLLGAVPYLLTGAIPRFADAIFETASGFTTTGATILSAVEHLPPSVLLWRSLTQWMGGMGVLVLFLAVMPKTGDGAVFLMRAESPGPIKSKLVPKPDGENPLFPLCGPDGGRGAGPAHRRRQLVRRHQPRLHHHGHRRLLHP